ncbi:hypothetical protein G3I40_11805 [Streptomyces sp. SID14478]|uniref:DUF6527 family protein n=1 Tax=Streptomyces sp. SID14478 TaxID=2706073 RepID=UPI0013DC7289|nr:DUF6527 family protein [Streptomyces sp. SID14478]NEB75901.1 hypothetical protein [Streptomyces sp. SID14478]
MTAQHTLRPVFTETFPSTMDAGALYISIAYRTCGHLCCCGCGHEVVTPLSPAQWTLTYDGENVSLAPSVGNWSLPCQSHYWIHDGRVRWSRRYSTAEITQNRDRDHRLLAQTAEEHRPRPRSRLRRLLTWWRS